MLVILYAVFNITSFEVEHKFVCIFWNVHAIFSNYELPQTF